jgi:branched-chain amino acid aminotransferase
MSSLESKAVVGAVSGGPLVWLNGKVMPLKEATTTVADHAYLYGDGLFEGIRIYKRNIFKLDEHLTRLYNGVKTLHFRNVMPVEQLKQVVIDTCKQAGIESGYIRLNVTRGNGLGLDPRNIEDTPNVMVMVTNLRLYTPEQYEKGLKAITCSTRVFPPHCLDPRLKTIGRYVANIQAKIEADRQGAGEGLMLNVEGFVAEATGDNVFIVRDGVLSTPTAHDGILQGITRNTVIGIARDLGHEVVEERLTLFDVYSADEAFFTGTAAEIISMVELDQRQIGDGKPGPVTQKILEKFRELTPRVGVSF